MCISKNLTRDLSKQNSRCFGKTSKFPVLSMTLTGNSFWPIFPVFFLCRGDPHSNTSLGVLYLDLRGHGVTHLLARRAAQRAHDRLGRRADTSVCQGLLVHGLQPVELGQRGAVQNRSALGTPGDEWPEDLWFAFELIVLVLVVRAGRVVGRLHVLDLHVG